MDIYRMYPIKNDGNSTFVAMDLVGGSGGYVLPNATRNEIGGVKMAAPQNNSTATDVAGLVSDFNALLSKLRTVGIIEVLPS